MQCEFRKGTVQKVEVFTKCDYTKFLKAEMSRDQSVSVIGDFHPSLLFGDLAYESAEHGELKMF